MSSRFIFRWHSLDKALNHLLLDVIKAAGCPSAIELSDPSDITSIGDYIILLSDGRETFEDVVLGSPDNHFIVIGSPIRWSAPNMSPVDDLMACYYRLKSLVAAHKGKEDPEVGVADKRAQKARRLAKRFVQCIYCGKAVSVLGLGLKSHEEKCRGELIKKPAKGRLLTGYQVCGKSKGSILFLELSGDFASEKLRLPRGLHIIADAKLIKHLCAELKNQFKFQLEE